MKYPDRFAGFASLPMQSPDAAATELTRAVKELGFVGAMVNGTTDGRFLDHPSYDGILATAAQLDVPIYIHPHIPPAAVRQAYFSDLPEGAGRVLETAGWGWHSEVAVHVLRMVVAGTLDKHPKLKLIIGHMGEMLPMMLDRASQVFSADIEHLKRTVPQTILDQVWITTSGIFNEPPLYVALTTFGIDRIMFSVDYPYSTHMMGREFLDKIWMAPADMAKLCHGNADALLKLKVKALRYGSPRQWPGAAGRSAMRQAVNDSAPRLPVLTCKVVAGRRCAVSAQRIETFMDAKVSEGLPSPRIAAAMAPAPPRRSATAKSASSSSA